MKRVLFMEVKSFALKFGLGGEGVKMSDESLDSEKRSNFRHFLAAA